MRRTLKDSNLKVRALRRARELREVFTLLSFFLPFFRIRGTFNTFSAFEYNFPDQRQKTKLCTASLSLTRQQCKL